jgi:hypothetical protein
VRATINALGAGRRADVQAFRRRVLPGRLLDGRECVGWIDARHAEEPPDLTGRRLWYSGPYDWHYLAVATREGGVLDELRTLSERLAQDYGWDAGAATVFVLTGEPPGPELPRVSFRESPARKTLLLEVTPEYTKDQVASIYEEYRAQLLDHRTTAEGGERRTPGPLKPRASKSDWAAELAIFIARHEDGKTTWRQAWEAWIAGHPNDRAESVLSPDGFRRAATRAYESMMGRTPVLKVRKGKGRRNLRQPERDLRDSPYGRDVRQAITDAQERFLADLRAAGWDGGPLSDMSEEVRARFEELRRLLPRAPWERSHD